MDRSKFFMGAVNFTHDHQIPAKVFSMKKIAVIVLAALPVFAVAQQPDQLKQLKQENAQLRIQVTNLQNALMQAQAQEAAKNISEAHKQAVNDLEALNPGMKWDEQQGKLVAGNIYETRNPPSFSHTSDSQQVKDHGQAK